MSRAKVVLHIGLPKTGSTAIQDWLARNVEAFRRVGIHSLPGLAAHRLAVEAIALPVRARSDVVRIEQTYPREAVEAQLQRDGVLNVVSSEYFYESDLDSLSSYFTKLGVEVVKVIAILRRQDLVAASGYNQDVKRGQRFDRFTDAHVGYCRQLDLVATYLDWRSRFPKADFALVDYQRVGQGEELLRSFAAMLIEDAAILKGLVFSAKRSNPSLNAEMLEVARMLNERGHPFRPKSLIALQAERPGPSFGFSRSITRQFEELYLPGNAELAAITGNSLSLAQSEWQPQGVDLTGQIDESRLAEIVERIG